MKLIPLCTPGTLCFEAAALDSISEAGTGHSLLQLHFHIGTGHSAILATVKTV